MDRRVIIDRKLLGAPTITAAVEFQALIVGTPEQISRVADRIRDVIEDALGSEPVQELSSFGQVRGLTKEETLTFTPRRKHMDKGGSQLCKTPHVSQKNLVRDRSLVDCRLCLAALKTEDESGGVKTKR